MLVTCDVLGGEAGRKKECTSISIEQMYSNIHVYV